MANHRKNLEGVEVGYLTPVRPTGGRSPRGDVLWLVRCRCGTELVKKASELLRKPRRKNQVPQSCGCAGTSRVYSSKYGGAGHLSGSHYGLLQTQAKHRGHDFKVTIAYLWSRFVEQGGLCALTGVPLYLSRKKSLPGETRASLDRIRSDIGYIEGNVQWVHPAINFMKHSMEQEKFVEWCALVARKAGR